MMKNKHKKNPLNDGCRIAPPPISELATLASNIQTEASAEGKVNMAIAIWEAAHDLHDLYQGSQQMGELLKEHDYDEKINKLSAGIKLSKFLIIAFPKSHSKERLKWYNDYVKYETQKNYPSQSSAEIEARTAKVIEQEETMGVTNPASTLVRFIHHRRKAKAKTTTTKTSNGGKAKAAYGLTKDMKDEIGKKMKLGNFLKVLFPQLESRARLKWYREYLIQELRPEFELYSEKQIEAMADERIMNMKDDGIKHDLKTAAKIRKFGVLAAQNAENS